ncbi:MAG: hypothetical protein ACRD0K_07695 [Egibacteraceae bacterium]
MHRLYPTAYGCEFIERMRRYLTSEDCWALLLRVQQDIPDLSGYKAALRAGVPSGELLRNLIHMPASLGELYSDLALFFGKHLAQRAYDDHHDGRHARRLALHRALLAARPSPDDHCEPHR